MRAPQLEPGRALWGPALPLPFARGELPRALRAIGLWPPDEGPGPLASRLAEERRGLEQIRALAEATGHGQPEPSRPVRTPRGEEDGGVLLPCGTTAPPLRAFVAERGESLDATAPERPLREALARRARRVLGASGEHAALLSDGAEVRLLLCEPGRDEASLSAPAEGPHRPLGPLALLAALARPEARALLPRLLRRAREARAAEARSLGERLAGAAACFHEESRPAALGLALALCHALRQAPGGVPEREEAPSRGPIEELARLCERLEAQGPSPGLSLAASLDRLGPGEAQARALLLAVQGPPGRPGREQRAWLEALTLGDLGEAHEASRALGSGGARREQGAYYTPSPVARFLVEEALGRRCDEASPEGDPDPGALLSLRVLDPSAGAGVFLVEACELLGARLLEACRLCVGLARQAEALASGERGEARAELIGRAERLRQRLAALPSPGAELASRLARESPSALARAALLARRLVAERCVFGVEIDEAAALAARLSLAALARVDGAPAPRVSGAVACADALCSPPAAPLAARPEGFDAVVGNPPWDAHDAFVERALGLLARGGALGLVLPGAFHAAEPSAPSRRRLFAEASPLFCYGLDNRAGLFDIDARSKIDLVVVRRLAEGAARPAEASFEAAFGLSDPAWLEGPRPSLAVTPRLLRALGEGLPLPELRGEADRQIFESCLAAGAPLGLVRRRLRLSLGQEANPTHEASRLTPVGEVLPDGIDPRDPRVARALAQRGYAVVHDGRTFHQYDDRWGERPRRLVGPEALSERPSWARASASFRLAFRDVASGSNDRTGVFCLLPPGAVCTSKAPCERAPWARPVWHALWLLALGNSFVFDWLLRLRVQSTVSLSVLDATPAPVEALSGSGFSLLARAALALSCTHEGYAPLLVEAVGWAPPPPLPASREALRAAIDAVVARAYGLDRAGLERVLGSFAHAARPGAPGACLEAFDELERAGLEAFAARHDPFGGAQREAEGAEGQA